MTLLASPTRRVRRRAGAAAVVVAGALALGACSAGDQAPVSDPTGQETATPEPGGEPSEPEPTDPTDPTGTSETPGTSPGTDAPTDGAAGTAVPVYFAGDGPGGRTVLFREFHRVEGDPLTEAARLVAGGGQPDDPDYRTLWPAVDIAAVTATDGVLLVEVPTDAFTEAPDGMSRREARLALQQLVYTLQGVQQDRVPVVVERTDAPPRLFGLPTDAPFEAARALRTLNLVSITSPAEGDTVSGDALAITGVANSVEASGPCRILRGREELAAGGYQAEAWMGNRLFPFEAELPLDGITGEVTLRCETDDPSGGTEGPGPAVDTKTITVR
ncbi:Gmad2 immunoglobulin-like domain-containing protein [Nocardioides xinjiangensis]|uniref:Gmad2 immunoglobulin-like domain-containing protein n=1 Tax=Nocardioides xinjiangensis TaxID=2817376 RepID=UPI001B3134E1|nr:Gmad2 immunoglobulin-like domain-containing protein [Nocardioides sp. SYSU D00778]